MNNDVITHGLIIDTPWIDKILSGDKVWEMRSKNTNKKGPIALIQKGTKRIFGVANIYDCEGPLGIEELGEFCDCHRIPSSIYEADDYKWNYAWKLKDVQVLRESVPYIHKSGAVIWVELDDDSRVDLTQQLTVPSLVSEVTGDKVSVLEEPELNAFVIAKHELPYRDKTRVTKSSGKVPYAKDGTYFCPVFCKKSTGYYIVGEKGNERSFHDYEEAIEYLRNMPSAKWRRPNPKGNWGIVTAASWKERSKGVA